ncbi:MAG TPA: SPOR domain-containing protein [Chryseosolibacter sp.]
MARRKKQDENSSSDNTNQNDDTFGLPEIEYQPLNREETTNSTTTTETYYQSTSNTTETPKEMEKEEVRQEQYSSNEYYDNDEDGGSPWPKILSIALILILAGAAVWYFAMYRPKQLAAEQEKARQEQEAKDKQRLLDLAESKRLEDERRRADSLAALAATPPAGTIDTLTERTGRYYVIIASGIDGDLILDYAKKLAPKGVSPKIIPPYGKVKFYRLAIAEGDTYAATQATADQLKSEYTDGAWVVKY